jgi:hypothetical protein
VALLVLVALPMGVARGAPPASPRISAAGAKLVPSGIARPAAPVAVSPRAPVPLAHLGSTGTNWYVANWSGEGSIAENPANPLNLVTGGLYQAASAANNSSSYEEDGVSGAFTSWDGGRTWTPHVLPPSPMWTDATSVQCGHIHLADTSIVFGKNSTVYYIDLSYPIGSVSCDAAGSTGLYVTISGDGGNTWQTPICIAGTSLTSAIDKPWAAIDPVSGEVYVAYTDDGNGSGIFLRNSTDGGQHWSAAVPVSQGSGSMRGVEIAVDAWGAVDAAWIDQSTAAIEFARSTDHGHSFSTPVVITHASTSYPSSSPDSFRDYTLPSIAVDAFRGNAFTGTILVAWHDGTGGSAGSPRALVVRSTDNGSTWASTVAMGSRTGLEEFQPSEAFGADGTVYADWYAEDPVNGHLRLDGSVSHDGGRSWDPEVTISDVDAVPSAPPDGNEWWIGDYTDMIADAHGGRPLWTDARSQMGWTCAVTCLWGYVYNISFYTAEIVNGSIGSTVPVSAWANGTIEGAGAVALGAIPAPADWRVGDRYALTVPSSATWNGSAWSFAYWYGRSENGSLLFSRSSSVNGTVNGSFLWRACFAAAPGGTCQVPGAPGFLDYRVAPASANVWIDGARTGISAATPPLSPGTHWFNASAPGFVPAQLELSISPGNVTFENLSLRPIPGTLRGNVSPAFATVTVNGTFVPVGPGGEFSIALPGGEYLLRATALDYASLTSLVPVSPGNLTPVTLVLAPLPGWINGTADPAGAALTLNGRPLATAADGSFSVMVAPGTYWVNGTAAGYLPGSTGPIVLGPFGTAAPILLLVRAEGTLAGEVTPASAVVLVNGTPVATALGSFRVALPTGAYTVSASAPTYDPVDRVVVLTAGTVTPLVLALNLSGGWILGTVQPTTATVQLDGVVITPTEGTFNASVPAGSHTLLVSSPGFGEANETLVVFPGRASEVAISLTRAAPAGSGTPIWGSLGPFLLLGALVAGVGVYLIGRRPRPPRRDAMWERRRPALR